MTTLVQNDEFLKYCDFIDDLFIRGKINIPVLPEVAGKIVALANSDNVHYNEMVALLHKDSVVAGHVLKVANSPAYGSSQNITSLKDASQRLGTKLLSEITLSVSLKSNVFLAKGFKKIMQEVWDHSITSALWAKNIAKLLNLNKETSYVSGLMHSIGMAMVLQSIAFIDSKNNMDCDIELANHLMARYHTAFTKFAIRSWDLPEVIKVAASEYSTYKDLIDFDREAGVVFLADKLANWTFDSDNFKFEEIIEGSVVKYLSLSETKLLELKSKKDDIKSMVSSIKF